MSQTTARTIRPNPVQMLFHVGKTSRLAGALLRDRRVSIFRKIFFIASLAVLVILLIIGDAASELISNILPFVGPVLDIPADATLDWVTLAIVSYNLLRVFPPELVSEHYNRLFRAPAPHPQAVAPATPPRR